jgi:HSP20 family molecular chaperone IbpA
MSEDDFESWMWSEAIRRQERANRLQRQFFRRVKPRPHKQWEPPVDIFETAETVYVIVALPGVSNASLSDLEVAGDRLYVAGHRAVPMHADDALLHCLEIPQGYFERRIILPWPRLIITDHELVDGCLYLTLAKR